MCDCLYVVLLSPSIVAVKKYQEWFYAKISNWSGYLISQPN